MRNSKLFKTLYACKDEFELHEFISSHPALFDDSNWKPLGDNKSNYGIVKNPTNSIDALLAEKCLELKIDSKSSDAPETTDEVVARFFLENN
jgi:hypothetical protein